MTSSSCKIIVVGDVHWKREEPYFGSLKKVFKYLLETYPDYTVIFTGDFYDTSTPHWEVYEESIKLLKSFKQSYILTGNHDASYFKGNALSALRMIDNIRIITEIEDIAIDGVKFRFYPYTHNAEMLDTIQNETVNTDYIITHLTPAPCAYGDEGVVLKNKTCKAIIHGHIHEYKDFDAHGIRNIVIGVPQVTRNLEQHSPKRIVEITGHDTYDIKDLEIFLTIEDVKYGEEPKNKDNIINIIDAPSIPAVYVQYKDYHIRKNGIRLVESSKDSNAVFSVMDANVTDLSKMFDAYCESLEVEDKPDTDVMSIIRQSFTESIKI